MPCIKTIRGAMEQTDDRIGKQASSFLRDSACPNNWVEMGGGGGGLGL